MVSIYDVKVNELIEELAKKLKDIIKMPEWAQFVKTGVQKERPPERQDWWYIRVASVLRAIYRSGPVGVSKLRSKYGGSKSRGVRPHKFRKGSGKILRTALQQLEAAGLVKQNTKNIHKGRIITPEGQKLLDGIAKILYKKDGTKLKSESKPVSKPVSKPKSKPASAAATAAEKSAPKPAANKGSKKPASNS